MEYLCRNISKEKWRLVDIGKVIVSCAEVRAELCRLDEVQQLGVGKNKTLVVPKSMFVGNPQTEFADIDLLTSYEAERYRAEVVGRLLGCSSVTHEGIDTVKIFGRKYGDVSILLDSQSLSKFDSIIFSQRLDKDLRRMNAIVAYCLGEGRYFCASSFEFMEYYANRFIKDRVMVSKEVFK